MNVCMRLRLRLCVWSRACAQVKSKSAYLSGVLWRHRRFDRGPRLPLELHKRLDHMYRHLPALLDRWLDAKALETLSELEPPLAHRALNLLEAKDLAQIRNLSGCFMACLKEARMDPVRVCVCAPAAAACARVRVEGCALRAGMLLPSMLGWENTLIAQLIRRGSLCSTQLLR